MGFTDVSHVGLRSVSRSLTHSIAAWLRLLYDAYLGGCLKPFSCFVSYSLRSIFSLPFPYVAFPRLWMRHSCLREKRGRHAAIDRPLLVFCRRNKQTNLLLFSSPLMTIDIDFSHLSTCLWLLFIDTGCSGSSLPSIKDAKSDVSTSSSSSSDGTVMAAVEARPLPPIKSMSQKSDFITQDEMTSYLRGPEFIPEASRNVTSLAGRVASLNCRIKNLDNWTVWLTFTGIFMKFSIFWGVSTFFFSLWRVFGRSVSRQYYGCHDDARKKRAALQIQGCLLTTLCCACVMSSHVLYLGYRESYELYHQLRRNPSGRLDSSRSILLSLLTSMHSKVPVLVPL